MASELSSGAATCKYCGKASGNTYRQYLNLEALCLHELPPHQDLVGHQNQSTPTLAGFLQAVLAEAYQVDFDDDTWIDHGKYPSSGSINVTMPGAHSTQDKNVCIKVEKRVKGKTSSAFLARRSFHYESDVEYVELDTALSQDHCAIEAKYDPSIFDGNRLLEWSTNDLQKAVQGLKPEWGLQSVQISMFEMFHEMPVSLLEDRVFHVLCITAHSANHMSAATDGQSTLHPRSHTLQLPVNIQSFRDVSPILSKSHFQQDSKKYIMENAVGHESAPTARQKKHSGKNVTEGIYCSLERLSQVPGSSGKTESQYRWDMMTCSDAKGSTRFAPWSIKKKETLEAIAKDVEYVFEHIRKQRSTARGTELNAS